MYEPSQPSDHLISVIAADTDWMDLAASAGHEVRSVVGMTLRDLRRCEVVVIRRERAWERIRAWRAAGVSVGVVVVVDTEDSPDDRPRLEPVVLLRRTDAIGFAEARERLAVGEAPARVPLASGVADFHRGVFERVDGALIRLTGLEARLLSYLAARSFRVVGRDELQEQVWGYRSHLETKAVEMTIGRLRKKIEQASLLTVRGEGYRAVRVAPPPEPTSPQLEPLRKAIQLLLQHGQSDDALALLGQHDRHRDPADVRSQAEALLLRSRILVDRNEHEAAATAGLEALRLGDEAGWPLLVANACCAASVALRFLGRTPEALAHNHRAEELFSSQGDRVGTARALALRSELVPPADGFELVARAVELFVNLDVVGSRDVSAVAMYANLRGRLATGHRREGRIAEALESYVAAESAYRLLGRVGTAAQFRMAIAGLRSDLGDDDRAARDFQVAMGEAPKTDRALVSIAAASHELVCGRHSAAVALARSSLAEAGELGTARNAWIVLVAAAVMVHTGHRDEARRLTRLAASQSPQHDAERLRGWLEATLLEDADHRRSALSALAPPESRFERYLRGAS